MIVFRTRQSASRGGWLMLDAEDAMKLRGGNAEGVSVTRKHVPLSIKTLSMMVYPATLSIPKTSNNKLAKRTWYVCNCSALRDVDPSRELLVDNQTLRDANTGIFSV